MTTKEEVIVIALKELRGNYIKIKTRDGDIEIYYEDDRTCVEYTDLSGRKEYMFTLKDGEHLWLDGT